MLHCPSTNALIKGRKRRNIFSLCHHHSVLIKILINSVFNSYSLVDNWNHGVNKLTKFSCLWRVFRVLTLLKSRSYLVNFIFDMESFAQCKWSNDVLDKHWSRHGKQITEVKSSWAIRFVSFWSFIKTRLSDVYLQSTCWWNLMCNRAFSL